MRLWRLLCLRFRLRCRFERCGMQWRSYSSLMTLSNPRVRCLVVRLTSQVEKICSLVFASPGFNAEKLSSLWIIQGVRMLCAIAFWRFGSAALIGILVSCYWILGRSFVRRNLLFQCCRNSASWYEHDPKSHQRNPFSNLCMASLNSKDTLHLRTIGRWVGAVETYVAPSTRCHSTFRHIASTTFLFPLLLTCDANT